MLKKITKICALILSISICAFFLLEIYCRFIVKQPYYSFPNGYFVNNQFYGYELAKNFKGSYSQPEFTISIDTNSDGLRDIEHRKCDECIKILALGDSFSFGVGVELNNTYLSLLEKMLNDNEQGKRFQIIKAGIIGYSTYNERIYLEKKGLNFHPNTVIIQFWWDDLGVDHITYLADMGFLTTGKVTNFLNFRLFLNRHFRSYAFLRSIVTRKFNYSIFADRKLTNEEDENNLKNKFSVTLNEFQKIVSICNKNNISVLFILVPCKEFVYDNINTKKQWGSFCELLNKSGIRHIDLLPVLHKAAREGQNPFFKIDPHLNEMGHRLIAEEILKTADLNH